MARPKDYEWQDDEDIVELPNLEDTKDFVYVSSPSYDDDEEFGYRIDVSPDIDYDNDEEDVVYIPHNIDEIIVDPQVEIEEIETTEEHLEDTDITGKFVDKENKKVLPFGGNKIKTRNFDERKNKKVGLIIIRLVVMSLFVGMFGLGIYNTFFKMERSDEEIEKLVLQRMGDTGFPLDRGQAFAEEFLHYYLNFNKEDIANQRMLAQYYTGDSKGSVSSLNVSMPILNKQRPIQMPITFERATPTSYLGVYKMSVLVTDENGNYLTADNNLSAHWLSFQINVYYDVETKQMTIHPDSPTSIPTYAITNNANLPAEAKLGNGKTSDSMISTLTPTVEGFIKAYLNSSTTNHNEVIQYIPDEKPIDLISGYGGTMKIADGSNIQFKVYQTNNPDEWKVDVRVNLQDTIVVDPTNTATYKNRYVMTVVKTPGNKYLVTKFSPYVYIKQ